MKVAEAAVELGVTPRRVRAMIADGRLRAHRDGSTWVIDELAPVKTRRSLSPRSWEHLARALKHRTLDELTGHDRSRTAERIRRLRAAEHPSRLIADWRPPAARHDAFMESLAARAANGDDAYLAEMFRRRPEYLRDPRDLAEVVRSEREIQGLSRSQLAAAAEVPVSIVADLERRRPLTSPGSVRSVLAVLGVEPTALPEMSLS